MDDDEKIPYLVGEVFIYQNKDTTDVRILSFNPLKRELGNDGET